MPALYEHKMGIERKPWYTVVGFSATNQAKPAGIVMGAWYLFHWATVRVLLGTICCRNILRHLISHTIDRPLVLDCLSFFKRGISLEATQTTILGGTPHLRISSCWCQHQDSRNIFLWEGALRTKGGLCKGSKG